MGGKTSGLAKAYMLGLFDDEVVKSLGTIAGLDKRELKSAIESPGVFLETIGLQPPDGVSVTIFKAGRAELGVLEPGHPPGGTHLPICMRFCFPAQSLGFHVPMRCVTVCF